MAQSVARERTLVSFGTALRHSFTKLACSEFRNKELLCALTCDSTTLGTSPGASQATAIATSRHHRHLYPAVSKASLARLRTDHTATPTPPGHPAYSTHTASLPDTASQDKKLAFDLLSSLRHSLPAKSAVPQQLLQCSLTDSKASQQARTKTTHQPVKRAWKLKQEPATLHSPAAITASMEHFKQSHLQQLQPHTPPRRTTDHLSDLHDQLGTVLAEAQAQPHWKSNPDGFHTCLDNVELLFRQVFSPAAGPDAAGWGVDPSHANLSQCINTILPVLLIPQQSPAPNIAGVTEFLHELLELSGKAMFHCLCQEPAILYSDVYSDLVPMHEYFDTLHWAPADYKHIIVRHPQLLLLQLPQLKKNVGYLLGQGLSRQHILEMWKQRAGLMVESIKTLHGQMLGLRQAGRPLQDLALPAALRPPPAYGPVPQLAGGRELSGVRPPLPTPSAVSAVVGTSHAVYLYNLNRRRARAMKGIIQNKSGQFLARAHLGGGRGKKTLGVYATISEAARAYDAAVFKRAGKNAKLNFPEEYADRM